MRWARTVLSDRAAQGLAVTHQGVELLSHTRLGCHPVAQQDFKARQIQLGQQQPEGRVRWRLAEIGSQQLVERLPVAFGETLHSHQRTLAAQDREDRYQQHPPRRKRLPRRMRQSGSALRKLIRSLAAAGLSADWEAKGQVTNSRA